MSRLFKGKAPRRESLARMLRFSGNSDTSSSNSNSNDEKQRHQPQAEGVGASNSKQRPESPVDVEMDFCFSDDDSIGMGSMGGEDWQAQHPRPPTPEPVVPEPPHPDTIVKEEVFDALAYCGFLDIKTAFLFRWAVGVAWAMQVYRQSQCKGKHRGSPLPASPPVALYRLFAANAILPHTIRASATTRVLIVLYALYYLAKVPICPSCATKLNRLDLSLENPREFAGVDEAIISKCVIEWAGAMRCSMAMLVDLDEENYWESHTLHISDKTGASITRVFQLHLDYKFTISNEQLIAMMHAITDDHPISLTPTSRRKYCPPPGVHAISNWYNLISV